MERDRWEMQAPHREIHSSSRSNSSSGFSILDFRFFTEDPNISQQRVPDFKFSIPIPAPNHFPLPIESRFQPTPAPGQRAA